MVQILKLFLVSTNEDVIRKIQTELEKQLSVLPRKDLASKALENSKAILVKTNTEAIDLLNEYAPEPPNGQIDGAAIEAGV